MRAYVINLDRSPDRRAHIVAELRKTGLDYEIVSAVDGRELDLNDTDVIDPALFAKNAFPAGTAGCALSHLRVYEKILADGASEALVLEDDVILPADLAPLVDAVASHLTGAEVALLNYGSPDRCRMSAQGCVELPSPRLLALPIDLDRMVNAAAYVITRHACERMAESVLPVRANADDWQYFFRQGMLDRIRCVLPLAVDKHPGFESTIGMYSVGNGVKARLAAPLVRSKIPLVQQVIRRRRGRILREWGRSEIVDLPFTEKPSRLG
jgi:glycosyl transferase family 25